MAEDLGIARGSRFEDCEMSAAVSETVVDVVCFQQFCFVTNWVAVRVLDAILPPYFASCRCAPF